MSLNILTCGDRSAIAAEQLRPLLEAHRDDTVWLIDPGCRDERYHQELLADFPNLHVDPDDAFVDCGEISRRRRDVQLLHWGIDLVLAFGDGPRAAHVIRHAHTRGIEVRRLPARTRATSRIRS